MLDAIQRTTDAKWPMIPRLVAGLPLALIGLASLVGAVPVAPLARAAGLPAPDVLAIVIPVTDVLAGFLLCFGWLTRVGAALGILAMLGAITLHLLIPDNQWPQPASGAPGPEPLAPFLLAWLLLGACILSVIRGGGLWSADRRQVASRAAARGGGLGAPTPRVKAPKRKKNQPPAEGESVW